MNRVIINFHDMEIAHFFAHVVDMQGHESHISDQYSEGDKVVTEASFYDDLPLTLRGSNCLLVGEEDIENGYPAITLTRPLNETKIDQALFRLLGS